MGLLDWLFGSTKHKPRRRASRREAQTYTLEEMEAVAMQAKNLARIVEESIGIARRSKNPRTVISRIEVARDKFDTLKKMGRDYPFLILETLDEVELTLQELEIGLEVEEDADGEHEEHGGAFSFATYGLGVSGGSFPNVVREYSQQSEPESATAGDQLWIGPGEAKRIGEWQIPGGMLYVGKSLLGNSPYGGSEPSLINPKLKAKPPRRGSNDHELGYWPSYSDISAGARAIYLDWLASGRSNPDTPIGFVFLFFYGLERRILLDAPHIARAREEVPTLIAEIERLLSIYDDNRSFRNYANQLLAIARVKFTEQRAYELPAPDLTSRRRMDLSLLIPLGQLIADEKPIPAAWALAWCIADDSTKTRTPAKRCPEEFGKLFTAYYKVKFGDGLRIKPNKKRLREYVMPASSGLGRGYLLEDASLPDVGGLSAPVRKFQELFNRCMDDLDSYSRLLGRDPDALGTAKAFALLPDAIATASGGEEIENIRLWTDEVINGGGVVPVKDAMSRWPCSKPEKMSKRETVEFAQCLDRLGVGMEPDVRFAAAAPQQPDHLVLFRLSSDHPDAPAEDYVAATVLIHLAAMVAAADGSICADEERHLEQHLEQALQLSTAERERLSAHLEWLLKDQPGTAGLKKRLAHVPTEARTAMASFAISVAGADGHIDPAEIKTLRKIYGLLGLEQDTIYADIHSLVTQDPAGPATGPVTVQASGASATGFKLPSQGQPAKPEDTEFEGISLDMELVKKRLEQTREVSALLSGIFTDEDADEGISSATEPTASQQSTDDDTDQTNLIEGLDAAHSTLLRALALSPTWTADDFQTLVENHGLMPSGAMETLNEAAFDACDDALFEGEDPIHLNNEILQEMLA